MQARYSDVRLRLNGAAAIVCAGAAFYYYAIRPLEAARRGEPHIPFPREIILFGPMFVCYGAFFLIFGAKARDWTVRKDVSGQSKMTKLGGWLMLIIFIVGLSAAGWIYSLFTDLGYEFSAR